MLTAVRPRVLRAADEPEVRQFEAEDPAVQNAQLRARYPAARRSALLGACGDETWGERAYEILHRLIEHDSGLARWLLGVLDQARKKLAQRGEELDAEDQRLRDASAAALEKAPPAKSPAAPRWTPPPPPPRTGEWTWAGDLSRPLLLNHQRARRGGATAAAAWPRRPARRWPRCSSVHRAGRSTHGKDRRHRGA